METMEFMRGDANYHTFGIPASAWTAGGRLFFAAKPALDDDVTDAAAQITANWDDTVVTDVTYQGVAYKQYACTFPPSATAGIISNGADVIELLGEFQYVPVSGVPVTAPAAGDDRIPVAVTIDVKRKTVV